MTLFLGKNDFAKLRIKVDDNSRTRWCGVGCKVRLEYKRAVVPPPTLPGYWEVTVLEKEGFVILNDKVSIENFLDSPFQIYVDDGPTEPVEQSWAEQLITAAKIAEAREILGISMDEKRVSEPESIPEAKWQDHLPTSSMAKQPKRSEWTFMRLLRKLVRQYLYW